MIQTGPRTEDLPVSISDGPCVLLFLAFSFFCVSFTGPMDLFLGIGRKTGTPWSLAAITTSYTHQISYTIFCSPILICCHRFNYPEMKRNEQMNPCEPSANLMARMDALPSNEQREAGLTHSSDLSPHSSRVISSPVVFLQTVNLGRNAMVWPSIPHFPLVSASLHLHRVLVY